VSSIYPVNPKADEIAGLKSYPDIASLPRAHPAVTRAGGARLPRRDRAGQWLWRDGVRRGGAAAVLLGTGTDRLKSGHQFVNLPDSRGADDAELRVPELHPHTTSDKSHFEHRTARSRAVQVHQHGLRAVFRMTRDQRPAIPPVFDSIGIVISLNVNHSAHWQLVQIDAILGIHERTALINTIEVRGPTENITVVVNHVSHLPCLLLPMQIGSHLVPLLTRIDLDLLSKQPNRQNLRGCTCGGILSGRQLCPGLSFTELAVKSV
jgi:hypothetical protein